MAVSATHMPGCSESALIDRQARIHRTARRALSIGLEEAAALDDLFLQGAGGCVDGGMPVRILEHGGDFLFAAARKSA